MDTVIITSNGTSINEEQYFGYKCKLDRAYERILIFESDYFENLKEEQYKYFLSYFVDNINNDKILVVFSYISSFYFQDDLIFRQIHNISDMKVINVQYNKKHIYYYYVIKFLHETSLDDCNKFLSIEKHNIVTYMDSRLFMFLFSNYGLNSDNHPFYINFEDESQIDVWLNYVEKKNLVLQNICCLMERVTLKDICCLMERRLSENHLIIIDKLLKLIHLVNTECCKKCHYNFHYFNYIDDNNVRINEKLIIKNLDILERLKNIINGRFNLLTENILLEQIRINFKIEDVNKLNITLCKIFDSKPQYANLIRKCLNENHIKIISNNKNYELLEDVLKLFCKFKIHININNLYYYYSKSKRSYNLLIKYSNEIGMKYNYYPYKHRKKLDLKGIKQIIEYNSIQKKSANNFLYYSDNDVLDYIYDNVDLSLFDFNLKKVQKILSEKYYKKFMAKLNEQNNNLNSN